jgi:predicted O-methyltransferase YrrM
MSNKTSFLADDLHQYMLQHGLREPDILCQLRKETATMTNFARMQTAPEQAPFMQMLLRLMGAKRVLELGTFTGYSALAMALALPEDGQIIACDINRDWTAIAQRYWQQAGVAHKIDLRIAPALETLALLREQQQQFDFIFIDADKDNYPNYYDAAYELVRPGGVIAIDNVLWGGAVADTSINDNPTRKIRALNEKIRQDTRVEISLVPIADGIFLVRKC